MKNTTIDEVRNIIDNVINAHGQYEDEQSHNSTRVINDVVFILGEICGIAIIHNDYVWQNKDRKHYLCVLLGEDDDYWFVQEREVCFDPAWLREYQQVMKQADDYYQKHIVPELNKDKGK